VRSNGKVLIHCHQGISRSSAFVICYLMWKNKWGFQQAHDFTKEGRYIASPNSGFIWQLLQWRKLLDEETHKREMRMFRVMRHSRNMLLVPKKVPTPGFPALDPRGCFIVQTSTTLYYWIGERCSPSFVEAAKRIISYIQKYEDAQGSTVIEVLQGAEPDSFWQSIGNSGPVSNVAEYSDYQADDDISIPNGTVASKSKSLLYVYKTEKCAWEPSRITYREGLPLGGLYLLQTASVLYVWVGEKAEWDNITERALIGEAAAKNFIYSHFPYSQETPPPFVVLTDPMNEDKDFLAYFSV